MGKIAQHVRNETVIFIERRNDNGNADDEAGEGCVAGRVGGGAEGAAEEVEGIYAVAG
jgi:hypothetical protein